MQLLSTRILCRSHHYRVRMEQSRDMSSCLRQLYVPSDCNSSKDKVPDIIPQFTFLVWTEQRSERSYRFHRISTSFNRRRNGRRKGFCPLRVNGVPNVGVNCRCRWGGWIVSWAERDCYEFKHSKIYIPLPDRTYIYQSLYDDHIYITRVVQAEKGNFERR